MHNLSANNGVQNSADPRSPLKRFRLHELKLMLRAEGIQFNYSQGTAHQARMLLDGVDINKYIMFDANGHSHFKAPEIKETVKEELVEEAKKPVKKTSKKEVS